MEAKRGTEVFDDDLIPGLADDVALICLARLPLAARSTAKQVCARWRRTLDSGKVHSIRATLDVTDELLCMAYAVKPMGGGPSVLGIQAYDARCQLLFWLPPVPPWEGDVAAFSFDLVAADKDLYLVAAPKSERGRGAAWRFNARTYTWHPLRSPEAGLPCMAAAIIDRHLYLVGVKLGEQEEDFGSTNLVSEVLDLSAEGGRQRWATLPATHPMPFSIAARGRSARGLFYVGRNVQSYPVKTLEEFRVAGGDGGAFEEVARLGCNLSLPAGGQVFAAWRGRVLCVAWEKEDRRVRVFALGGGGQWRAVAAVPGTDTSSWQGCKVKLSLVALGRSRLAVLETRPRWHTHSSYLSVARLGGGPGVGPGGGPAPEDQFPWGGLEWEVVRMPIGCGDVVIRSQAVLQA